MVGSDSLSVGEDIVEFSSFGADINLGDGSVAVPKFPARAIKVVTAGGGGLVVVMANGAQRTLSGLTAGEEIFGKFAKIVSSGTTVSKVRVTW